MSVRQIRCFEFRQNGRVHVGRGDYLPLYGPSYMTCGFNPAKVLYVEFRSYDPRMYDPSEFIVVGLENNHEFKIDDKEARRLFPDVELSGPEDPVPRKET